MKSISFKVIISLAVLLLLSENDSIHSEENIAGQDKFKNSANNIRICKNDRGDRHSDNESSFDEDGISVTDQKKKIIYTRIRRLVLSGKFHLIGKELNNISQNYSVKRDAKYFFYWGFIFDKKGLYRKAVEYYLKSIKISPDYSRARNSLGTLYCRLHKYNNALKQLQRALRSNPCNPFLNYNLGNLYFEKKDYYRSIKYLKLAIEYKKNFGSAFHKLGVIMYRKKRYADSIEYFRNAIRFRRWSHLTYYYLGLSYYYLNKGSLAISNLKRALFYKRNFFKAVFELGKIYHSYGEFMNAIKLYKRAKLLNPDCDEVHLLMVSCYSEMNRYGDAIRIIRKLLENDKDNEILKKYLKDLKQKRLTEGLTEPYDYYQY